MIAQSRGFFTGSLATALFLYVGQPVQAQEVPPPSSPTADLPVHALDDILQKFHRNPSVTFSAQIEELAAGSYELTPTEDALVRGYSDALDTNLNRFPIISGEALALLCAKIDAAPTLAYATDTTVGDQQVTVAGAQIPRKEALPLLMEGMTLAYVRGLSPSPAPSAPPEPASVPEAPAARPPPADPNLDTLLGAVVSDIRSGTNTLTVRNASGTYRVSDGLRAVFEEPIQYQRGQIAYHGSQLRLNQEQRATVGQFLRDVAALDKNNPEFTTEFENMYALALTRLLHGGKGPNAEYGSSAELNAAREQYGVLLAARVHRGAFRRAGAGAEPLVPEDEPPVAPEAPTATAQPSYDSLYAKILDTGVTPEQFTSMVNTPNSSFNRMSAQYKSVDDIVEERDLAVLRYVRAIMISDEHDAVKRFRAQRALSLVDSYKAFTPEEKQDIKEKIIFVTAQYAPAVGR